jgi:hypothetical protein
MKTVKRFSFSHRFNFSSPTILTDFILLIVLDYYDENDDDDESMLKKNVFPMANEEASESEHSDEPEPDENDVSTDKESRNYQNFLYKIVDFVRQSNLTKSSTSSLLSLLQLTNRSSIQAIPTTTDSLWKQLNISFDYETFFYCSTCFSPLVKFQDTCTICNNKQRNNSELCIFSLAHELQRVVRSNIKLIEWYQLKEHQINADIVTSKA